MSNRRTGRNAQGSIPAADAGPIEAALQANRGLKRRDFLRVSATLAAGAAVVGSGCQAPVEHVLPTTERPEGQRLVGKPRVYATVIDGAPVLVKTREGRPILVTPNPEHPGGAALTLRSHASLLDLYDPDRAPGPLSVRRGQGTPTRVAWQEIADEVLRALKAEPGRTVLLARPVTGFATRSLLDQMTPVLSLRVVEYDPLQPDAAVDAWRRCFGDDRLPRPRLDRADVLVGLGAEFIDCPGDGLEADFATRRSPAEGPDGMSRFIAFEGRLSLTGANADQRVRVRDSHLPAVAMAILGELVASGTGPLAGDPVLVAALRPFATDAVAAATGVPAATLRATARELAKAGPRGLVVAGDSAGATPAGTALHTAVALLNLSLGNWGTTVDPEARVMPPNGGLAALATLADDLRAGTVDTVIIAGPNPVYDAPTALGFADALGHAKRVISLNDRVDETSRLADLLAPASHPFEAWGDVSWPGGLHGIQQPAIRPLNATFGLMDLLLTWSAAAGIGGDVSASV